MPFHIQTKRFFGAVPGLLEGLESYKGHAKERPVVPHPPC